MKRRDVLVLLPAAFAVLAGPAFAARFEDEMVAQLTAQGFARITKETTWLGRVQIYAERSDGRREIVLNPRTGEILRDIWSPTGEAVATKPILDTVGHGTDSGSGFDDSGSNSGGTTNSGRSNDSSGGQGGSDKG